MLLMILGVLVQYVDGNQRIVCVSELFSDNEDITITSGEDDNSLICCVYGSSSCSSLDHVLDNLTSNVLINITTDVTLSSLVRVTDLENVSIIGHNNPTVNCTVCGGIHFAFCNNCIIQGITWDGCGTGNISNDTEPGLKFSYSSNVTIQSCFFQQSVGQAVVLSEMLGDVSINNCMFMNNSQYRGHGAAVHYSSSANNTIHYSLEIKNCKFSYNKIKSLVYLENKCNEIILNNSTFNYNQGISVYATNQKIYLNGKVLFENNTAKGGTGIYISDHSTVTFVNNSEVTFIQNSAKHKGGGVFLRNHSSIIFDQNSVVSFINNSANNGTVYSDACSNVTFKGNCNVIFSGNSATQRGAAIYSDNSLVTFMRNSNVIFSNNYVSTNDEKSYDHQDHHGGIIYSINFSNISFEGISTTLFNNNTAYNGGVIYSSDYGSISFEGNSNTIFSNNYAAYEGGAIYYKNFGSISFKGNACTIFSNNTAGYNAGAIALFEHVNMFFGGNSVTIFIDNKSIAGGAIFSNNGTVAIKGNSSVTFNSNTAQNGGAMHYEHLHSDTFFEENSIVTYSGNGGSGTTGGETMYFSIVSISEFAIVTFNNNTAHAHGGAVHCERNQIFLLGGNSIVTFSGNKAMDGGAVHALNMCKIIFKKNSNVEFKDSIAAKFGGPEYHGNGKVLFENNIAENGAGIYINKFSKVMFNNSSNVKFINNFVNHSGAAVFLNDHSSVLFDQNAVVAFNTNSATQYGSAIYSCNDSNVTFTGNSNVNFNSNICSQFTDIDGIGTVYSKYHSSVSFEENSTVEFHKNIGYNGGAIVSCYNSIIIFEDDSTVLFSNNEARNSGGAIFSDNGNVTIKGNSSVTFDSNTAQNGGAIYCEHLQNDKFFEEITYSGNGGNEIIMDGVAVFYSIVSISGSAIVIFKSNTAHAHGGAVHCEYNQIFLLGGNSNVTFSGNKAIDGGAVYALNMCKIIFKENSNSSFSNNLATNNGGTILSREYSDISFMGTSKAIFNNNAADNGGIFYLDKSITLSFNDSAVITFTDNKVKQHGGVLYSTSSFVLFNGNSMVSFVNNDAKVNGGVMYCDSNSNITFTGSTNVSFNDNKAIDGGVLFANNNSKIIFEGHVSVTFIKNEARSSGGVGYFNSHCSVTMKQNCNVTFENNNAILGGALCINSNTNITFTDNSTSLLKDNKATNDGGAINIQTNSNVLVKNNATLTFNTNNALYGGAMFFDATNTTIRFSNTKRNISFMNNTARIAGDDMYIDSAGSISSCVNNRIIGETQYGVASPPNKLKFYNPAICIDDHNSTEECNEYYLKNIMLGEEINIPVCVLNYCNQPSYSIRFLLQEESNQSYSISGKKQVLLSCNYDEAFQGISVIGKNSLSKPSNYTINITLHDDLNPHWKQISVNLNVELTPCHPGFWQYPRSEKCECYNAYDIVFCSGGNSAIKRGYWFGKVAEQPTVTFCPINYCNFTCCEASNGYYYLSPARDNQCRSHRSGTACGNCTDGYTLSFDSPECVNVDSCTAGETILVILITVTYWIVMVTLVFAMMYYKVPIGYLYSITYYYSIVDIILSLNLQEFRGFFFTVSIMSSFSKITPQFLGELCLTTGMSGIDQQFIHYIHPTAVILILAIISLSARSSRRISAFISRGIIHVICLLLLLSYTSIASTSLLLMRSLKFHDIDKIYTYLSPDIEYFHGRHLAYGIVALLCTVTIVLGLPLLLILEPFLNHKINFTKVKPLLDQFQGCYKDKFRCFAGYYMVCRLVIITIIIANLNHFLANYLLIVACGVIALIHIVAKPYNIEIVNKFDGMVLQLIIFVTVLPYLFDDFDLPLATSTVFVFIFLPLVTLTVITLFIHKDDVKKVAIYFTFKDKVPSSDNVQVPMKEFDLIVDDSARNNATTTVCDT